MPWKGGGKLGKKREKVKTGRVESVIEGCVALRKRDWRKVFGRAVLLWSDFDGQEQTEQTVERTELDPVLARPQTQKTTDHTQQEQAQAK